MCFPMCSFDTKNRWAPEGTSSMFLSRVKWSGARRIGRLDLDRAYYFGIWGRLLASAVSFNQGILHPLIGYRPCSLISEGKS